MLIVKSEPVNTIVLFLWPPAAVMVAGGFLYVLVQWCMMGTGGFHARCRAGHGGDNHWWYSRGF